MSDSGGVVTRWWWIRHAPIDGAVGPLYGQMDVGCVTADGAAFRALADVLPRDAVWLSSHLRRTRDTAAAIAQAGGFAIEPVVEPDLAEQHFGAWEGRRWSEMAAEDPAAQEVFWRDPTGSAPPGGESFSAVLARVAAAVARLTEAHAGRDIVAVAHGGSIRAALAQALALGAPRAMALTVDNLSLTRIDHVGGGLLRGHGGAWRIGGVNLPPRGS